MNLNIDAIHNLNKGADKIDNGVKGFVIPCLILCIIGLILCILIIALRNKKPFFGSEKAMIIAYVIAIIVAILLIIFAAWYWGTKEKYDINDSKDITDKLVQNGCIMQKGYADAA